MLQDAKEVSKQIRVWKIQQEREDNVPWTREDRLRKSASDLVDTESDYVRVHAVPWGNCLMWLI